MTAKDKKTAQVLVGLLVVAGLVWFFVYRTSGVTSSAKVDTKGTTKHVKTQDIKETKINLGGINASGEEPVGQKNIFQYRQKPAPVAAVTRPGPIVPPPTSPPPVYTPPRDAGPPPPPPMKNFKYDGFSGPKAGKGKMVASLTDGTTTFQVTLGECLMGQYCVRQLSENTIEIEDLQLKQRKTFTRTPAP